MLKQARELLHHPRARYWKTKFQFLAVDGQTAPYCLLLLPESPCRRGPVDFAVDFGNRGCFELNGKIGLHWAAG
jgi:hypothetical protein